MSPRSTIGCAFGANRTPILRLVYQYLQKDQSKLPLDPRHLGVPSGVPLSMPVVHSVQTVHLSSTETYTTPNGPKQASTWHTLHRSTIGCAQSDFHARGTFSAHHTPNISQWASAWPMSPRSTIRCIQNDFWDYGMFGANLASILHRD
jgi:hypothetical protein